MKIPIICVLFVVSACLISGCNNDKQGSELEKLRDRFWELRTYPPDRAEPIYIQLSDAEYNGENKQALECLNVISAYQKNMIAVLEAMVEIDPNAELGSKSLGVEGLSVLAPWLAEEELKIWRKNHERTLKEISELKEISKLKEILEEERNEAGAPSGSAVAGNSEKPAQSEEDGMVAKLKEMADHCNGAELVYVTEHTPSKNSWYKNKYWSAYKLSVISVSYDIKKSGVVVVGTLRIKLDGGVAWARESKSDGSGYNEETGDIPTTWFSSKADAISASKWTSEKPLTDEYMNPVGTFRWDGENWNASIVTGNWPIKPITEIRPRATIVKEEF